MCGTNTEERVATAIARVRAITWNQPDRNEREGSQIALMFELLRRMALWAEALESRSEWPFFSVAEAMAARSDNVRRLLAQPAMASIEDALDARPGRPRSIGVWYVQWSAIEALPEVRALALPEPYEPALRIFERGGWFHIELRMFQFFIASFPLGTLARSLERPPLALDDATLALRDESWRLEVERHAGG